MTSRNIDIHTHIITEAMMRDLGREAPELAPVLRHLDANHAICEIGGLIQDPYYRGGWDIDLRLQDMDAHHVDMQLLSPGVQTFFYNRDEKLTQACSRLQNEHIAAHCRKYPDRFMGLAAVPLQAPELAAAELEHAMSHLGLYGAQIGSHVNGINFDHPMFEPFWAKAEALRAFILIHPHQPAAAERLTSYYFRNFIGLTLETTIAAASLVFGGVMQRHPDLRICLCHAGGFVPYQMGRFAHGWAVRPEAKRHLQESPEQGFKRFYYDTITHGGGALAFLLQQIGIGQVLLGSDYPFDMGNMDCVDRVEATQLGAGEKQLVLGRTAGALLKQADCSVGLEAHPDGGSDMRP